MEVIPHNVGFDVFFGTSRVIVALIAYWAQMVPNKLTIPRRKEVELKAKNTHVMEAVAIIALYPQIPSYTSCRFSTGSNTTPRKQARLVPFLFSLYVSSTSQGDIY